MERDRQAVRPRTRRAFLRTSAVGVGVAASGIAALSDGGLALAAPHRAAHGEVTAFGGLATTGEALAATLYDRVLTAATFHVDEVAQAHIRLARAAHLQRLALLRNREGHVVRQGIYGIYLPRRILTDAGAFVQTGREIEAILSGLYVAAVRELARQGRAGAAATAAQRAASAAHYRVLLGQLAGLSPSVLSQPAPTFDRMPDVARSLAPYLHGEADWVGPLPIPAGT